MRHPQRCTHFPYTTLFRSPGSIRICSIPSDRASSARSCSSSPTSATTSPYVAYCCIVDGSPRMRSEEHTSELQSHSELVCGLLLEKRKQEKTMRQRSRRSL